MPPASRPQWQQATALITIGAGSVAGLTFVPKPAADLVSPASVPPVTLLALEHASAPAPGRDAMLRAAIVHIARHFLRLAETRSPAEMEAMIWQYASTDGANHGPSCAAFASLTLELGSHIAGLDSWVSGGTSYPWPVHAWVDGRVDPNPASPGVVSVLQDARTHGRWHPAGDGYTPQPGDWVLFDGHVEVVTKYHGGVLHTIGGDSLPNMSVNAHEYSGPLQDQGVAGFVDNGAGMSKAPAGAAHAAGGHRHSGRAAAIPGSRASAAPASSAGPARPTGAAGPGSDGTASGGAGSGGTGSGGTGSGGTGSGGTASAGPASSAGPVTTAGAAGQQFELEPRAVPAPRTVPRSGRAAWPADRHPQPADRHPQHSGGGSRHGDPKPQQADRRRAVTADVPATGLRPARPHHARRGEAAIPGLFKRAHRQHPGDASGLPPYHRHDVPPSNAPQPGTATQQAFINEVARGAMATQDKYGVPASVTIAQAIDESGWGQSVLAANDHNLFGIKGTGPAGSDVQPTQEVINGQLVNLSASFQIYENIAQSIDAHGRLLAHGGDYANAMSQRKDPNAFAAALTGVYATDPSYGAKLIQLMKQYDLYRFNQAAARGEARATHHGAQPTRPARNTGPNKPGGGDNQAGSPAPQASPGPRHRSGGHDRKPKPGPIGNPVPVQPAPITEPTAGQPAPIASPVPVEPGPLAPAHDAKPARATKPGASVAARQAGIPRSGQTSDHMQTVHHDAVTTPTAMLYPGRSARPAPLAHPARPAGLSRPSGPAVSNAARAAASQAQQPVPRSDPAPGTSRSGAGAGYGQPTGDAQPEPAGPGGANISGDAAIPGVPHAVVPQAGHARARQPIGRLGPAHPAGRATVPSSRARLAGPTAPAQAAAAGAGAQHRAAPNGQITRAGADPTRAPRTAAPAAAMPAVSQAGSAMIPGLQQHGPDAHAADGLPGGPAAAPDGAAAATASPGGSSIPGARPGADAGPVSRASAGPATAPSHAATATVVPGGSSIPGAQPAAATGSVGQPPARRAVAPSPAATTTVVPGGSSIPGARPGARPGADAGPVSRASAGPATAPSHAATATVVPGGSSIPGAQPAAGAGAVPQASGSRTTAPARQPTARGHAPAAPGHPATAPPSPAAAPRSHPPAPGHASAATVQPANAPADGSAPGRAASAPTRAATRHRGQGAAPGQLPPASRQPAARAGTAQPSTARASAAAARPTASTNGGAAANSGMAGNGSRAPGGRPAGSSAPGSTNGATLTVYHAHMPPAVREAFLKSAKAPLVRSEPLYRDVASHTGIRWELLAACDWMQCKARHGYSPVYGEKLGTLNPDDTCYRTKSAALEQCASDLVQLARSVYQLDIATSHELSVRDLANVFAAFRWGGLLRLHCTSAMDFPYSIAGLTADHTHMRWPNIDEPNAPDKPGSRFRQPFGAVPVVLGLNYQALM